MKPTNLLLFGLLMAFNTRAQQKIHIKSPDRQLDISFELDRQGKAFYQVAQAGNQVLEASRLGLVREDAAFTEHLQLIGQSPQELVKDSYSLFTGKRTRNHYLANKKVFHLQNKEGKRLDIIFQVSNDGLAFRYYFPEQSKETKKISEEITSFNFQEQAKAFLQPMSDAKTGWAKVHPSYEEYYEQGIPVGTPSPIKAGWIYPALFQTGKHWVLISESFPEGNYCGTRLKAASPQGEYSIGFPQEQEHMPNGSLNPESVLPWASPWRIVAVGSLKTIVESGLGTDLAKPAAPNTRLDYIKPGIASWSWVLLKDDSTVYHVQKKFIDYAADMQWQYCLIDADWDRQIGYEKIKELADYGRTKNIGILLWYNSSGNWNDTKMTPKNVMLDQESRLKEFKRLQDMGIKGVKVDFFGGDGQSFMQYYIDILKDAAQYGLLVNFHGCTLPRGLQRTYPNLVNAEAIKGMEFITFGQAAADVAANHCAMLPFTRNAFDPMDFTPMALYQIPKIKRRTTAAFELALPVLFWGGVQHLAETPTGMAHMPDFVKTFLQNIPKQWDDVKFITGYPGKEVVIARKAGNRWLIAGINGENRTKDLQLDLSFLKGYQVSVIRDGNAENEFVKSSLSISEHTILQVPGNGGFVLEAIRP